MQQGRRPAVTYTFFGSVVSTQYTYTYLLHMCLHIIFFSFCHFIDILLFLEIAHHAIQVAPKKESAVQCRLQISIRNLCRTPR